MTEFVPYPHATNDPEPWVWNDTNLRTNVKVVGEFLHWDPRKEYDID